MRVSDRERTPSGSHKRREALNGLVRTHADALFGYCYRQLHDHHLAEDAVQEVFFRACKRRAVENSDNVVAWLFGAARRCCLEINRKRHKQPAGNAIPEELAEPPGGAPSEWLEGALERLDDAERGLIFMKYTQGLKCREIAETTGMPLGTVTGTLARAYSKLRSFMRKQGD